MTIRSTEKYRNSTLIKKKTLRWYRIGSVSADPLNVLDRYRPILWMFWSGIGRSSECSGSVSADPLNVLDRYRPILWMFWIGIGRSSECSGVVSADPLNVLDRYRPILWMFWIGIGRSSECSGSVSADPLNVLDRYRPVLWMFGIGIGRSSECSGSVSAGPLNVRDRIGSEKWYRCIPSCRQRRLIWAKEKNWAVAQWSKDLFSDESKFCISFGNQGPRVWRKGGEAHSTCCLKSSVKFPQSVMIWGAMTSAGVSPLCFLNSNVTAPVYQYILEHFMLPSADQLFKDADFIYQQDLAPANTAKSTKSWLNDHGVGVLDWPANSSDLSPIENLWGIVKRKMRNKRPKNADELKHTVKETWASIPPQQCHKLITSMPRRIEAVIKAKVAPTKYWVHIQYINILSRRPTIH